MSARTRGDTGAVAASVALLPLVITLFFTVIQVSLWYHGRSVAIEAANHGLEAARAYDGTEADGQAAVDDFLALAGGLDGVTVDVDVNQATDVVSVTIDADAISVLPGLQKDIVVTVTGPRERIVQ